MSAWKDVTDVLVNVTVLLGAVGAFVKFRLFNVFAHRWKTDVECRHWHMADGTVLFSADYTIQNTGSRRLDLKRVTVQLLAARHLDANQLAEDLTQVLAEHSRSSEDGEPGGFIVEARERTIVRLHCRFATVPDVVFVRGCLDAEKVRRPAAHFVEMYCFDRGCTRTTPAREKPGLGSERKGA